MISNLPSGDGTITPRRWAFFDWSGGPVHALHDDNPKIIIYQGIDALLDSLTEPTNIRCECTFESFSVARRANVVTRCKQDGHNFKVINPRATAKRRRAMGYEEKTDEIDVAVIRNLALDGETHFTPVVFPDDYRIALREKVNSRLMDFRRTKIPRKSSRSKLGFVFDSAKDLYATEIISKLPATSTLTAAQDKALCSGPESKRVYSKCVVAAVAVIAEEASGTKEFDFLAGLYQNGYPSQIRSDLMMHRWSKSVRGKLPFTDFRRELRWLFHAIQNATARRTRT